MPKGEHCVNLGQANVKAATEAKSKADKHLVTTTTEVTKASSAEVHFESRAFSSLTEGKCASFYTSGGYTAAKAIYTAAVTARTKANGESEEAAKALTAAIAAAAKEKLDCECKTKADHKKAFATHGAADAANQKAWNFACKVECVLDGKTNCKCSAAPKCKAAKLTAAVVAAQCQAAKKPATPKVGLPMTTQSMTNAWTTSIAGQPTLASLNLDPLRTAFELKCKETADNKDYSMFISFTKPQIGFNTKHATAMWNTAGSKVVCSRTFEGIYGSPCPKNVKSTDAIADKCYKSGTQCAEANRQGAHIYYGDGWSNKNGFFGICWAMYHSQFLRHCKAGTYDGKTDAGSIAYTVGARIPGL